MRCATLALIAAVAKTAVGANWAFKDATISITTKGAGVGAGTKHELIPGPPLSSQVTFGAQDTLKVVLTATNGEVAARAHQAFLTIQESKSGLVESYMIATNDKGKGKVEITHKDLPFQFIDTDSPLAAIIVIASFDSATPYHKKAFSLIATRDTSVPAPSIAPPLRYGPLPEIRHIFKDGPKSPPVVISGFFALAVLATLPALLGAWLYLGANFDHASQALRSDPISHALFYGSVVALEGVFFLYYSSWNLFQTLPVVAVVGVVALGSGSRALSEVQARRLAGQR